MTRRIAALGLAVLAAIVWGCGTADAQPPPTGDWVVAVNETHVNQSFLVNGDLLLMAGANLTLVNVTLNVTGNISISASANLSLANLTTQVMGNITVATGGNLTLSNVALEINSPSTGRRGITVENGGRFNTSDSDGLASTPLDRTFIRPVVASDRFFFVAEPGAYINITQTAMSGVGYTQSPANHSGVYLDHAFVSLSNLTVAQSFFGLVMLGDFGNVSLRDIVIQNNSQDGIFLQGATNVFFRGLISSDNGGAGLQAQNGTSVLRSASFLRNADGLSVKFGANSNVQSFDSSGNQNGIVALNGGTVVLSLGRVTNNTVHGVDARLASTVTATSVAFSDNVAHVYATGASSFDQAGGSMLRGVIGFQLRTGATLTGDSLTVRSLTGPVFDADSSSVSLSRSYFSGVATGGTIQGGTGFVLLDCTLENATVSGLLLVNATGVVLGNPTFRDNSGYSIVMVGSSTGLLLATNVASFINTTATLDSVNVTGTLWVENSTLHALRPRAWNVTGTFHGERGGIVGDLPGGSLRLRNAVAINLTQFGALDFTVIVDGDPSASVVNGFAAIGSGELEAANGTRFSWRNITVAVGATLRLTNANLELVGGGATSIVVGAGSTLWLRDAVSNMAGATYGAGATIFETWTVTVRLEWAPGVIAASQAVTLRNATGITNASGTTGAAGVWSPGYVRARTGTSAGVSTDNPYSILAGSGSWAVTATASFSAPTLAVIQLNDTLRPSVTILSPAPGSGTRDDPVAVAGTAAELESGLAELAWSYDNASFTAFGASANFSIPVAASFETSYTITVRATDLAGNVGWAEVTFIVDRTSPTITLSSPVNGTVLQGPTVDVAGRTEAGADLTVDGQAIVVDGLGDFSHELTLSDGLHMLMLTAIDAAGNSVSIFVNVTVDSTPPGIIVESPLNGTVLSLLQATLTGYVEPGASLSVNGLAYSVLANGSFTADAFLDVDGPNFFVLRSVDPAGNSNDLVWVLVRDTQAPNVAITGFVGSGPHVVNTTAPTFEITVDEDAVIEASTGSGSNLATFGGRVGQYHPILPEGNTTMTVVATDAGGNTRTVTFDLRVDVTPPTYTIDSASAGGLVGDSPWTITLTTEAGAQVTVAGAAVSPTTAGGGTFAAAVTLTEGVNVVNVTVWDAAGNRRDFTVVLTLDSQPPTLAVTAPADRLVVPEATVSVTGTVEAGATVTVGGSPVQVDAAGRFSVDYPLARGDNNIVVVATDAAGNTASVTRVVTREGGSGGGLTGIDFIDANLYALLLLIVLVAVAAAVASRRRRKQRVLAERSTAISREIDSSMNLRSDLGAMDNFSPRRVDDPDFESFDEFQRKQGGRPPGQ